MDRADRNNAGYSSYIMQSKVYTKGIPSCTKDLSWNEMISRLIKDRSLKKGIPVEKGSRDYDQLLMHR